MTLLRQDFGGPALEAQPDDLAETAALAVRPDGEIVVPAGFADVMQAVWRHFGVMPALLLSPCKTARVALARQAAAGMLYRGPIRLDGEKPSTNWVGRKLGRDHSTVLHAVRKYEAWCAAAGLPIEFDAVDFRAARLAAHLRINLTPAAKARIARDQVEMEERKAAVVAAMIAPPRIEEDPFREPAFMVFAQIHLTARPGGAVDVALAYDRYGLICRQRGQPPAPRTSFGVMLARIAAPHGGRREGDVVTGLAMKS